MFTLVLTNPWVVSTGSAIIAGIVLFLLVDRRNETRSTAIKNSGKNARFINNTFVGFDVAIENKGENMLALGNRIYSKVTSRSSPLRRPEFILAVVSLMIAIISIPWWPNVFQRTKMQLGVASAYQPDVATSTINLADVFSGAASRITSREQHLFMQPYFHNSVVARGLFADIFEYDDQSPYRVDMRVGSTLVTCMFTRTPEIGRRLFLLKKGDIVDFAGTFEDSAVFGGGWSIRDCYLLH